MGLIFLNAKNKIKKMLSHEVDAKTSFIFFLIVLGAYYDYMVLFSMWGYTGNESFSMHYVLGSMFIFFIFMFMASSSKKS